MAENDKKAENSDKNDDFQGFSEEFSSPPLAPRTAAERFYASREAQDMLEDMQKRYSRVQRQMLLHQHSVPRALRDESEALRANIAHFKRRWGLD